ncbi:MAG: radical SAM protein [Candidatus Heimdallarchaeaceae archaeon]
MKRRESKLTMWTFFRKDAMNVWQQEELKERLVIYRDIYQHKAIPRYKLARLFYVPIREKMTLEEKIELHEKYQEKFQDWVKDNQEKSIEELTTIIGNQRNIEEVYRNNYLKLKVEIAKETLQACIFCENKCKANRAEGKIGKCGIDDKAYLASAFVHLGEESPIVPSGTIFFYGCTMDCVFCQNWDISHEYDLKSIQRGRRVSPIDLARTYYNLAKQHVRNINFVGGDPTPVLHVILESFLHAEVDLPMLWNSNMYLSELGMKLIVDVFDIWLPDMKYGNNECARKYSKIRNYWDVIKRNMKWIEVTGTSEYIIRHLVMPGHVDCCSIPILDWIKKELEKPLVNIMAQYHPDYKVLRGQYPELYKRPTHNEMYKVKSYADKLGLYWKSVS